MNKRRPLGLVCFLVLTLLVTACSGGAGKPSKGEATTPSTGNSQPGTGGATPASEEETLIAGAKKEGKLLIYHTMPVDIMDSFIKDFTAKYPFLTVTQERQAGLANYQKFLTEAQSGVHFADIVHLSDVGATKDLISKKWILNYTPPTDDKFPADLKISGYAYVPYLTEVVIMVNSSLVSEADGQLLTTWEGILDPRFKGKIGTTDPTAGVAFAPVYMFLTEKQRFGEQFLRKFAEQKPVVFQNNQIAREAVVRGEVAIHFTSWESLGAELVASGAKIRWYAPKPTPSYGNSFFMIAQKAPHADAAKLWQRWLLSEDGAKTVATRYSSKSTYQGAPDLRKIPKENWYSPITERYIPDWDAWEKNYDPFLKTWRQILNYKPTN